MNFCLYYVDELSCEWGWSGEEGGGMGKGEKEDVYLDGITGSISYFYEMVKLM